jgi:NAD(P)-dependent dehydrogenase (short-subunit alcohol dehydrogenase family)
MTMRLTSRRILVTGAASGIGRATAELFAREGAKVALLDRDADALQAVAAATGGVAVVADLLDEAGLKLAIDKAADALGGLDGVINAAGIANVDSFAETTGDTFRRVVGINLTGTFLVCRFAAPWLQKEARATIVNIASGQALLPSSNSTAYGASKAGVVTLTKSLAIELAPKIRVNSIAPGVVETPMTTGADGCFSTFTDEQMKQLKDRYALKRSAAPLEIANTLLFLTSDESSFITGALLAVDGGRTFH